LTVCHSSETHRINGAIEMNIKAVGIAASILLASASAFAQSSTVTGAAGGAATGAVVGGPVGAAVGGIVGGIAGSVIDPPPQKVVTYVQQAPAPTERVVVKETVVVGQPLPETVVVTPIPDDPKYAYAIVNDQRVIVQPSSRKVIQVIQ
jgi:outer membrane lipoprotein SlyB